MDDGIDDTKVSVHAAADRCRYRAASTRSASRADAAIVTERQVASFGPGRAVHKIRFVEPVVRCDLGLVRTEQLRHVKSHVK